MAHSAAPLAGAGAMAPSAAVGALQAIVNARYDVTSAAAGRFKRLQQHFCHKAIPVVHVAFKSATIRWN